MASRRSRRAHSSSAQPSQTPPPGAFEISTGTASFDPVPGDPGAFVLTVNGVPSSPYSPTAPQRLDFEYMQWAMAGIDEAFPGEAGQPGPTLRVLHVGGAACALPRRIHADRPGSRQTVVELDAKLVEWVRAHLELPRSPAVAVRTADGSTEIAQFRADSLDLLLRDAFAGDSVPASLSTPEWFAHARRTLRADGLYAANVADRAGREALRAEVRGLLPHFPHICAVTSGGRLAKPRGNIMIFASERPLDPQSLTRRARAEGSPVPAVHGTTALRSACGL